ncbi:hypothetical protein [Stakelama pacifica]|uniref:hypothetical protein n=1 Tax=Stakelama pacifica TaxID=517720 RepID=UPI00105FC095|nr:hypothetical protein [Stakelama pacifica]GGO97676.1 hypothetical protein GCM10011329_27070 [Stakelama pacifica]
MFGDISDPTENYIPAMPLGFVNEEDREAFVDRSSGLEGDPRYQSYANREIARALLARRSWQAAEYEALLVASAAKATVKMRTPLFDALSECVLRYLAEHRFQFWPKGIDQIITPMAIKEATDAAPERPASPVDVRRLSDCLAQCGLVTVLCRSLESLRLVSRRSTR